MQSDKGKERERERCIFKNKAANVILKE